MPKAIKKKVAKPAKPEEGVKSAIHATREFIGERQKIVLSVIAVLVIVLVAAAGFLIYRSHAKDRAVALEYEGYKIYYALHQKQPIKREEQYRKALEKFQKAYETRKSPFSLFYIASCYYSLGKYDDATKTLEELNTRFPDDERFVPLSYYKMANISLRKGDREGALKLLDTIYNYRSGSFKDLALVESARILETMGRKDDSMRKYEELTKNFPASPFVEEAKAKLEGKKG